MQLKIVLEEETPSRTSDRQSPNFVQRDTLQIILTEISADNYGRPKRLGTRTAITREAVLDLTALGDDTGKGAFRNTANYSHQHGN